MKINIHIALFLCCGALNVMAQQHYQMMALVADNFLQNRNQGFEDIKFVWNMEGLVQADLNNGINYVLENKPTLAEGSLTIVLKKNPMLWQAYYYRAIARKQQKRYQEALEDLRAALKLKPTLYEAQVEVAKCYLLSNALIESELAVKRAIQIDKKKAEAYYVRGCLFELQNNGASAIRSFRDCLKADSAYHAAYINIALIMLVQNQDEASAIHELTSVLSIDSLQQDALAMRSILLFDKSQQQSSRDLDNLIRRGPGNIVAFYLRGMLLTKMQHYDRGFSDFQRVIKATSTSDNNYEGQQSWIDKKIDIQNVGAYTLTRLYGLGDDDVAKLKKAYCLIMINAFDKSIEVLNSTSNPAREPLTVYLRAVAHEHQGKHIQALTFYNEALRLDNTIADAYKKRGIYTQELKQWEKSISDFTAVLRFMPESWVIYKFRGVSYHHNKQFDKAIADYNTYLSHDSTNQQIIGYRGVSYRENNQRLNAYIDFAESHNTQAFDAKDMLHLVDSVLQKGDTTLALTALASFVRASPSFTEAYVLKFRLHDQQKDWPSIERELFNALRYCPASAPKEYRAHLLTLKGISLAKSNQPDTALDAFDEAVRADENNAFAYLERGKFLLANEKKYSKAASDLKKAASLGNSEAIKWLEGVKIK